MGTTPAGGPIRAAGAVLWRPEGARTVLALVHRPRYDDWSLPKGKLEDGESAAAAAIREIEEETGFRARLGRRLGRASYVVRHPAARRTGPKVVDYWAARACGGAFEAGDEVDDLRWVDVEDAADLVSHEVDRRIVESFTTVPTPTATVLLVRHGKAGDRSRWHGHDDLRPLTKAGRRQAEQLRDFLALFGPTSVHSAPRVRCVQTVRPLAEALGAGEAVIRDEPRLAEEGYWPDPAAGQARLATITDEGGVPVVCSQGGVIPDLVRALAGDAAADEDGDIPCRKGSTWVLSLRDRRLLAADYYDPP
ncbi:MAG TPA: NUDIX domain-containing protein [Pseudonocardiaceae bacterium]